MSGTPRSQWTWMDSLTQATRSPRQPSMRFCATFTTLGYAGSYPGSGMRISWLWPCWQRPFSSAATQCRLYSMISACCCSMTPLSASSSASSQSQRLVSTETPGCGADTPGHGMHRGPLEETRMHRPGRPGATVQLGPARCTPLAHRPQHGDPDRYQARYERHLVGPRPWKDLDRAGPRIWQRTWPRSRPASHRGHACGLRRAAPVCSTSAPGGGAGAVKTDPRVSRKPLCP